MPFVVTDGTLRNATAGGSATSPALPSRPRIFDQPLAGQGLAYLHRIVAHDAIYRSQPAVRSVVDFLAKNIASIKTDLYSGDGASRETLVGHPLRRLLRRPNEKRTRFAFYRALVADLCIYDATVAVKTNLSSGPGLFRIPPVHLKVIGSSYLEPDGFAITDGLGRTIAKLELSKVVYIRGYSPNSEARGVAPMDTLRLVLAEEIAAGEYREGLWRNGARITGVIERPKDAPGWSDPARERFLEEWRANWTGDSEEAGGTPILEEGMKFVKVAMSAVEAEYIAARKLAREEVDSLFHVDGRLLGYDVGGSSAGDAETRRGLYADTFGPWCSWIGEELALGTMADFPDLDPDTDYVEFNLEAKLRGHFLDQAEVISRSTGGPWLTRNEARALFNRPALPGGDELIVPLNVTTGGRGSPADTAPGAPGLGQVPPPKSRAIDVEGWEVAGELESGAKTRPGDDLPKRLRPWVDKTVDELGAVLEKARRAVASRLGAGSSIGAAFDEKRWRAIFEEKARAVTYAASVAEARHTMEELDVDRKTYDPDLLLPALEPGVVAFSAGVIATISDKIAEAHSAAKARGKADDDLEPTGPTPADAVDAVFAQFIAGRLLVEAATRISGVANFTRHDVGEKAGRRKKRWVVNSSNPRSSHAALNGVEVEIGKNFPNGAKWPGDISLPVDERVNCTCTIDF